MKRLLLLLPALLCALLLLSACGAHEQDTVNGLSPSAYYTEARVRLFDQRTIRVTTEQLITTTVNNVDTHRRQSYTYTEHKGNAMLSYATSSGEKTESLLADGVVYLVDAKKRMRLDKADYIAYYIGENPRAGAMPVMEESYFEGAVFLVDHFGVSLTLEFTAEEYLALVPNADYGDSIVAGASCTFYFDHAGNLTKSISSITLTEDAEGMTGKTVLDTIVTVSQSDIEAITAPTDASRYTWSTPYM